MIWIMGLVKTHWFESKYQNFEKIEGKLNFHKTPKTLEILFMLMRENKILCYELLKNNWAFYNANSKMNFNANVF